VSELLSPQSMSVEVSLSGLTADVTILGAALEGGNAAVVASPSSTRLAARSQRTADKQGSMRKKRELAKEPQLAYQMKASRMIAQ